MTASPPPIRLFVVDDLGPGAAIGLPPAQAHYLRHVMRRQRGDEIALFNGRDGEWLARIDGFGKGWCSLAVEAPLRGQTPEPDLWLAFAPLKRARIDFLVQKATELGAALLQPVLTRHVAVDRVNTDRLIANAVEAAEQCGRLTVQEVREPLPLDGLLRDWPRKRRLLFCDEAGDAPPLASALADAGCASGPWAVLTGPEGGFAPAEREAIRAQPFVVPVHLGPRILRAETAAVAALALWQGLAGDWR